LRAKGLMSEVDQRHREESLLAQRQALIELNQQLMTRKGQLSEVRFNLEQLPFAQSDRIQAMRNELSATDQRIAEVSGRGAYIVRAPIGGRVSLLRASPGQFADPRRVQLQIMPGSGPLHAELFIPVRAIGFVEVGQDVRILFDSFRINASEPITARSPKCRRQFCWPLTSKDPSRSKSRPIRRPSHLIGRMSSPTARGSRCNLTCPSGRISSSKSVRWWIGFSSPCGT
jgi:HlyD family secretion protein